MTVPSTINDLATDKANNDPLGGETIGTNMDDYLRAGFSIIKQNASIGADIASGNVISIPNEGSYFLVTGTTGITEINNTWNGRVVVFKFSGIVTLTHASKLLLFGSNITTAAGDIISFVNESAGVYRALYFTRAAAGYTTAAETATLTNKTIVAANNTITTAASGDLAATELDAALAELESEKAPTVAPTFTGLATFSGAAEFDSTATFNSTVTLPSTTVINILYDTSPQLGGDLDFNGKTANESAVRQLGDAAPNTGTTHTFNYAGGDMQQITCPASGTLTIAFANFPSDDVAGFIIDLVNGGDLDTLNWPTGMLFAGGVEPGLTTAGTDRLIVMSDKDAVLTLTESAMDIKA